MRYYLFTGFLVGFFALMASLPGRAQVASEEPLPEVGILTCGRQCANFVPAKAVLRRIPNFPSREMRTNGGVNEGFVWVRYTVGLDGKTRDIHLVNFVGPRRLVELTIEQVQGWTFEPATLDGKPVEESRYLRNIWTGYPFGFPGIRDEVKTGYNNAGSLLGKGASEEARALLTELFEKPELNFYERGTLALPLAKMALQRKDYMEARRIAVAGTVYGTYWMKPESAQELWQVRISADLMLGQIADASAAFYRLRSVKGFDPNSAFTKMMLDAQQKAAAAPQLVGQAQIPHENEGGVYWHQLSRHTFTFANVKGSLDNLVLSCLGGTVESKITPTAQWHVPKMWENCVLYVRGSPGTTFSLVETNDADNKTQLASLMAHHDQAVRANAGNPMVYMARGNALATLGEYSSAIADFSKAIELNPKLAIAYQRRGTAYSGMAKYAEGLADVSMAITLDPKNSDLYFIRASFHRALQQYKESLDDYNRIENPSGISLLNRAVTLFCLGEFRRAEEDLEKAIKQLGNDLSAYNWLHVVRNKRFVADDKKYSAIQKIDNVWDQQIANLFLGVKTLEEVEAMMAADRSPKDNPRWPCAAKFFFAQYKLEKRDVEGARGYLSQINRVNCDYAEADAATAELKRLDNPVKPVGANQRR